VARSLIKQLLSCSNLSPKLELFYDECITQAAPPSSADLIPHLTSYSQNFPVYAVVDAIDECSDGQQAEMISLFSELQNSGFKLIVSGRPHVQNAITDQLRDSETFEISADRYDVQNYIRTRLKKEENKNLALEEKCLDLANNVQGM
jgi:hypothetical protein